MKRILTLALVLLLSTVTAYAQSPATEGTFTITSVPSGDAPEWVREEWLGLTLPYEEMHLCEGDPASRARITNPSRGYGILEEIALKFLEKKSPQAAQWWRDRGLPRSKDYFCFTPDPLVGWRPPPLRGFSFIFLN
jgi:hypothetical protein